MLQHLEASHSHGHRSAQELPTLPQAGQPLSPHAAALATQTPLDPAAALHSARPDSHMQRQLSASASQQWGQQGSSRPSTGGHAGPSSLAVGQLGPEGQQERVRILEEELQVVKAALARGQAELEEMRK